MKEYMLIIIIGLVVILWSTHSYSQEPTVSSTTVEKSDKAIEQKFKIVSDIAPSDLEREIRKLNKEGYRVTSSDLIIVGDRITIYLFDEEDEDEPDDREK